MSAETALVPISGNDRILSLLAGHEAQAEVHALIRRNADQESLIQGLKDGRTDIRVLGGDDCFIKTDDGGIMQGAKFCARLRYSEAKIYTVSAEEKPVGSGRWVQWQPGGDVEVDPLTLDWRLTGVGCSELSLLRSINVTDEKAPDPKFDEDGRTLVRLTLTLLAVGLDVMGNWHVERIVYPHSPMDYFLETLASKSKQNKFKEHIRMGEISDFYPDGKRIPGTIFMDTQRFGDQRMGFLVDYNHNKDVKKLFNSSPTRNKNATKVARTIAKRLIVSSWLGAGKLRVERQGNDVVALFPMQGYRAPMDENKLRALAKGINDGKSITEILGGNRDVEVVDAEVSDADVSETLAHEAEINEAEDSATDSTTENGSPDTAPPESEPEPEPEPEPETPPEPVVVPETEHAQECRNAIALFNDRFGEKAAEKLIAEKTGIEDIEGVLTMGENSQAVGMIKALHRAARKREETKKPGARRVNG